MKHGQRLEPGPRFALPGFALKVSIAGSFFILPQCALADDEIRTSADVTTSAGWSSNPYSQGSSSSGSAYVEVDVHPTVSLVAEHSTLSLNGLFNYQHYFNNYSDSNDYGIGLDYSATPSARLSAHAGAHFDSSIVGGFDTFSPVINPVQPAPPVITGPDLALIGTRQRRTALSFSGDASYILSAYDTVSANAFYSQSHYGSLVGAYSNYHSYGGGLSYSRRVSAHLHLGVQASASRYVYQGLFGNSKVYSLQATAGYQFSDRWSANGALGVSFSDQSLGGRHTNLTGNLQVCRQGLRGTLCFNASDAVLPTGGTGTVDTKSAGASYSYRLTERSSFSVSGQYSRNDQPSGAPLLNRFNYGSSYLTASASYDRQLRQRLHLVATTHVRKIMGDQGNYPADFGGTIGIRIRLGDYR